MSQPADLECNLLQDEYHVLILGLDKAGKTNVLERLKTMFTSLTGLDPGKILPTVRAHMCPGHA